MAAFKIQVHNVISSWCCRETIAKKTRLGWMDTTTGVSWGFEWFSSSPGTIFQGAWFRPGPRISLFAYTDCWCKFTQLHEFIYANNLRHFIIIIFIFVVWIFEKNFGSSQIWQENNLLGNFWVFETFDLHSTTSLMMILKCLSLERKFWFQFDKNLETFFKSCSTLNSWQIIYGICHW
jgi:hypothetical protein